MVRNPSSFGHSTWSHENSRLGVRLPHWSWVHQKIGGYESVEVQKSERDVVKSEWEVRKSEWRVNEKWVITTCQGPILKRCNWQLIVIGLTTNTNERFCDHFDSYVWWNSSLHKCRLNIHFFITLFNYFFLFLLPKCLVDWSTQGNSWLSLQRTESS